MKSLRKFIGIVFGIFVVVAVFSLRSLFLVDLITRWGFHGVVLIEKNNNVIFKKSTVCSENPQFLCASLIKQITSTLILREVQHGTLQLDEKANKYLKKSQKIDDRIEIRHLLSHSSGLQVNNSAKFTPGTAFEYSNRGYIVLGKILENVTKTSFTNLAQNLFRELNMTDSFLIDAPTLPEIQYKHPCFMLSDKAETSTFSYVEKKGEKIFSGNPCGGLISTAEDLCKWNYQLHEGKILSRNLYELMVSPQIKSNFPEGYYGFGVCRYSQNEIYHIGYVCGYKSTMSYFPKTKISLVILENNSQDNYEKDFCKHRWIRRILSLFP